MAEILQALAGLAFGVVVALGMVAMIVVGATTATSPACRASRAYRRGVGGERTRLA